MKAKLTFIEPVLGTLSGNKDLATEFIASKHPDGLQEDEVSSIESMLEKQSTVFPRTDDGDPFMWDYQVKGFFKSACLAMIMMETMSKEELKKLQLTKYMYKRTIDKLIFVVPRKIVLVLPPEGQITECERPLRGETMRGERVSLARSEQLPVGTTCELETICLNKRLVPFIEQWLTYGELAGTLQWRSSGKGRFQWEKL